MNKYFAQLDENNKVINIIVGDDNFAAEGFIEYTLENAAYIGGDFFDGLFYPPKPFDSWIRFEGNWIAPIPKPEGFGWAWNEESLNWVNA